MSEKIIIELKGFLRRRLAVDGKIREMVKMKFFKKLSIIHLFLSSYQRIKSAIFGQSEEQNFVFLLLFYLFLFIFIYLYFIINLSTFCLIFFA